VRPTARRWLALTSALVLSLAIDGVAWAGISVSPPPVLAANDAYGLDEDATLTVAAAGVLENDTPIPGACVGAIDTSSLAGELTLAPDGSFEFVPNTNFNGVTSFVYGLAAVGIEGCPGPYESQATVTLTVSPVNDPPSAQGDAFQFIWGQTLNIPGPGVLANDGDVDGDGLTALRVTGPVHGVLTLAANGGFSYTPAAGACPGRPDAFSYRASDGSATSAMRTVRLNPAPLPCPTATPPPTPTPAPTATPEPTPTAATTTEPSPAATVEPSPSIDPSITASPEPSIVQATASPSPSAIPEPVEQERGLSLPVLLVLVLFVVLLGFGAAYLVPRRLRRQRGEPLDPE
jgi:Bacterial cadherin-like domain